MSKEPGDKEIKDMLEELKSNTEAKNELERTDLTVEDLVKIFTPIFQQMANDPIDNFEFNISKAKVLYTTSLEIMTVWPHISARLSSNEEYEKRRSKKQQKDIILYLIEGIVKFFEYGASSYFVYTENALVTAISALEIYFRDRFIYEVRNNKKSLENMSNIEIRTKVKRLLEIDVNNDIDKLILDGRNFQSLQDVREIYNKLFDKPFIEKESELKEIEKISAIRHLIVHRGGIIDEMFLQKFYNDEKILEEKLLDFELNNLNIGERLILDRDQIIKIINFIEDFILDLDASFVTK